MSNMRVGALILRLYGCGFIWKYGLHGVNGVNVRPKGGPDLMRLGLLIGWDLWTQREVYNGKKRI